MNNTGKTTMICMSAVFTALICVGAFIKIPLPIVPFTLQYEFTMLAGMLLGKKYGAFSVLAYVLIGLMGIPVFTAGGGISYVLMPDFGYLIGFIIGAYVTGMITWKVREPSLKRLIAANLAGMVVVYIIGMTYVYIAKNVWMDGDGIGIGKLLFNFCLLIAPKDTVMCILTAIVGKRLIPFTEKYAVYEAKKA